MQLHKTDKGRAELKPGVRNLGQRARTLLLMADGSKTAVDFLALFKADGQEIVLRLIEEGYLETQTTKNQLAAQQSAAAERQGATSSSFSDSLPSSASMPLTAEPANSTDSFDGKRSLATTRMFLFDICERMFARRNPEAADVFREALRNAKDRQTMLSVSRDMIELIEEVAGHERADSISERIAMLLPSEQPA